jgi:hypothetical protein
LLKGWACPLVVLAGISAIACVVNAVKIARRALLPSPEKQAAQATAQTAAGPAASSEGLQAFFSSLEADPSGQPAASPVVEYQPAPPWNLATPVPVARGEHLPARLRANLYADNMIKIGCSLYVLLLLTIVGVALGTLWGKKAVIAEPSLRYLPPVVAVGLAVTFVVLGWRSLRKMGSLTVELSDHPLAAGRSHEIAVSHPSLDTVQRVRLELVCEEEGFAGRGKHGKPLTETKVVWRQPIALDDPGRFDDVRRGAVEVPPAPGSFALELHKVRWSLQARLGPWLARYQVEVRCAPPEAGDLPSPTEDRPPHRVSVGGAALWIEGGRDVFLPGQTLTGGFQVGTERDGAPLQKIELSILWWAEKSSAAGGAGFFGSKPAEEMGVCHFQEYAVGADEAAVLGTPYSFRTVLPAGPPSFQGKVFAIRWAVRLRLHDVAADESVCDLPFVLAGCGTTLGERRA